MMVLSIISIIFLRDSKVVIIASQIKSHNRDLLISAKERNPILISVAFLIISMKSGAPIALFVEGR